MVHFGVHCVVHYCICTHYDTNCGKQRGLQYGTKCVMQYDTQYGTVRYTLCTHRVRSVVHSVVRSKVHSVIGSVVRSKVHILIRSAVHSMVQCGTAVHQSLQMWYSLAHSMVQCGTAVHQSLPKWYGLAHGMVYNVVHTVVRRIAHSVTTPNGPNDGDDDTLTGRRASRTPPETSDGNMRGWV